VKRLILSLVLITGAAFAQTPGSDPNEEIRKIVTVKYIDPNAVVNLLRDFNVGTRADTRLKVVALSGRRANVTVAEEAIKQLDVPSAGQKDIDLTVYFVVGSDQAPEGSPIPADLQGTIATLKSTFPYKAYYQLDALSLRTRSGVGANTTGQLSGGRLTTFRVNSASTEGDGSMIRLDNLHAGLRVPASVDGKSTYLDTGIYTDVLDIKEGQKLVVGRSSLDGPTKALFLILIAKVVAP